MREVLEAAEAQPARPVAEQGVERAIAVENAIREIDDDDTQRDAVVYRTKAAIAVDPALTAWNIEILHYVPDCRKAPGTGSRERHLCPTLRTTRLTEANK
jgi:hypothetical protein